MAGSVLAGAKSLLRAPGVYLRRLTGDDLLKHGSVLAASTVACGALNYAFQIVMGRTLSPAAYGVFGSLFAGFYLVNVLGIGVQLSTTRFTAARSSDEGTLAGLHGGLTVRVVGLGVLIAVGIGLASPLISEAFGLASVWPVVIVAAIVPAALAFRTNRGTFQGRQWFGLLASYNVAYAVAKLVCAVALVLLGLDILGAFAGIAIATLLVVAASTYHVRRRLPGTGFRRGTGTQEYGSIYAFLSPAVLAAFCQNVPANVDVIIVGAVVGGEQAGMYVTASVLAKVLVFLPLGISKALFPKITDDHADSSAGRSQALLTRALTYVVLVTTAGAATFWLVPDLIVGLFFGAEYAAAAPLVRWYGLAIVPFAIALVVMNFELARDRLRFVWLFTAVTVGAIGLMWAVSGSMVAIIQVMFGVYSGLAIYGLYHTKL